MFLSRVAWQRLALLPILLAFVAACASNQADDAPRVLMRRVAVLRFANETEFLTGAFEGTYGEPLEDQAAALIEARLTESGLVVLIHPADFANADLEFDPQQADFVIVGTLSEFGRTETVKTRILARTKQQVASAAVRLRVIETSTSRVVYNGEGRGEAVADTWRLLGMGPDAPFDESLNHDALAAAIAEPTDLLLEQLRERPWRTVVIATEGEQVMIAGGGEQGLRVGDQLSLRKRGRLIDNPQIDGPLELPSTEVARLEVLSFFGGGPNRQGSTCRVVDGFLGGHDLDELVVEELR